MSKVMQGLKLRARFNSHRHYKGFYFKTDCFDTLNEKCTKDNENFSAWIRETKGVKFVEL